MLTQWPMNNANEHGHLDSKVGENTIQKPLSHNRVFFLYVHGHERLIKKYTTKADFVRSSLFTIRIRPDLRSNFTCLIVKFSIPDTFF